MKMMFTKRVNKVTESMRESEYGNRVNMEKD